MSDAKLVFRILADADVDLVVLDDRRGDEVITRSLAPALIEGVLRIAIELPDDLAGVGLKRIEPAVAAGEDRLRLAVDDREGRVGPLTVLQQLAAVHEPFEERLFVTLLRRAQQLFRWIAL